MKVVRNMIAIRSAAEIEQIRGASQVVSEVLAELEGHVRPGITTLELDRIAEEMIRGKGAIPAFLGLYGFPNTLCTSVNEQVVHGIPSDYDLKDGDIVSIDVGAKQEGYYGDAAATFGVGEISEQQQRLLDVTCESLYKGIEKALKGNRVFDISHAIQTHVEASGYSVVRQFVGHGIGTDFHEEPQVPNFGKPHRGPLLEPGMVLAIEPMVIEGDSAVEILEDKWTAVSKDRTLSAHFEHTIAITEGEPHILTHIDSGKQVY